MENGANAQSYGRCSTREWAIEAKLPVTTEDINRIYDRIDWYNPDSATLGCVISIARFFILRMREYLETGPKSAADGADSATSVAHVRR